MIHDDCAMGIGRTTRRQYCQYWKWSFQNTRVESHQCLLCPANLLYAGGPLHCPHRNAPNVKPRILFGLGLRVDAKFARLATQYRHL
jgi:hypothetical protein